MIENIINTFGVLFTRVVNLVGDVFDGGFGAVSELSSGIFE